MAMFFLNLVVAIGLFFLGAYSISLAIAKFIIESTDAEILAKVREYKRLQKEYENDY